MKDNRAFYPYLYLSNEALPGRLKISPNSKDEGAKTIVEHRNKD